MTTRHTAEPWHISSNLPNCIMRPAHVGGRHVIASGDCPENAARIVACVNYCAGIESEKLEKRNAGDMFAEEFRYRHEIAALRAENARLKEALQNLADAANAGEAYPGDGWKLAHEKLCGYARAALTTNEE